MAYIANRFIEFNTSGTRTLPNNVANDLILVIQTIRFGTLTTTPTGWTDFYRTSSEVWMYQVATSPIASISLTGSDSGGNTVMFVIRGADTTTPFDGVSMGTSGTVTTGTANALILSYSVGLGKVCELPYNCEIVGFATNGINVGSYIHETASTTTDLIGFYGGTSATRCLSIRDSGAGDLPGYLDPASTTITMIKSITRADAPTATDPTSFITNVTNGSYVNSTTFHLGLSQSSTDSIGRNSTLYQQQTAGTTTNGQIGVTSIVIPTTNVSSSLICVACAQPVALKDYNFVGSFIGFDDGTNARIWHMAGNDTIPRTSKAQLPFVFDTAGSDHLQDYGTPNLTSVDGIILGWEVVNRFFPLHWGAVFKLGTATIIGGTSTQPSNFYRLQELIQASIANTIQAQATQAQGQLYSVQPIQIGNGSTTTYWNSFGESLEFPVADDTTNLLIPAFVAQGAFSVTIKASSTDTINMSSTILSLGDFHKFIIDAASSGSATYTFTNTLMLNGDITLQAVTGIDYSGITFVNCKEITHNGADLSTGTGVIFDSCVDTNNVTVSGATQSALQTAISNFANCTFNNHTVAIRIEYTGTGNITINFDNITWSGNTADIHYNSTNASQLTANMQNGSNATTTAISGAATGVTIANDKNFTIICQDDTGATLTGAEVTILQTGTLTEDFHVETSTTGTEVYTFTAPLGHNVDVQVFKPGYERYWEENKDLGSADSSLTVQLRQVPAYEA